MLDALKIQQESTTYCRCRTAEHKTADKSLHSQRKNTAVNMFNIMTSKTSSKLQD